MIARQADIATLQASGCVDGEWYERQYPDVAMLRIPAAEHYLRIGAALHRNPSAAFDTAYYLSKHPDVARAGWNPLLHFVMHGRQEGRLCVPPSSAAVKAPAPAPVKAPVPARDRPSGPSVLVNSSTVVDPALQEQEHRKRAHGTYRNYPGFKKRLEQAKTVLVCAHVAGEYLFGGERSLLDILDGLGDAGYNVVVTTPGIGNRDYLRALRDRCVAVVSFRYGWWRKDAAVDAATIGVFSHVIAEFKVDAVHANTIMLREPLLAARRLGIPASVHVRELIEHDEALLKLIGETPQEIVHHVIESVDWVIANSEATANSFTKAGATHVIPNTIDTGLFDIAPPGGTDVINIAILSSNLPKKGVMDFVEVASLCQAAIPSARFLLIGPDTSYIEQLKEKQAAGEVSSNVIFAGYRDDPAKAMAEADIVLNLSHFQESFGRTVLEAMAARRPTIVYEWGALPELVVHGHTGFVVPFRDIAAVADRVRELCGDRARLRKMGEDARERAVALYGKPHYAARLESAYTKIFDAAAATPTKMTLPARSGGAAAESAQSLRIAYFLWHFPVPSETFVLNELRILVAQGHDVQVFCRQSPYKDFTPDFPIEWTRVQDPSDLAQKLAETGRTIVHSHFTYPTVTDMVWPACEMAEIPFTFIAHAQDIFRYSNDEKNQIGLIGQSPWCLRVLVPSRFHRDYVESRGVPATKLMINPNGIDPSLYAEARDDDRAARSRRSICAIHRYTEKKGLEHLIRAGKALALDGVSIHLYGYGDLEPTYRDLIAQEALTNVVVHGPVKDRAEMLGVFRQHDLFACPSVRAVDGDMDGIPTVLMEAMASGLPVLTTAISGIPDLVQDELTGIVCEADESSIVEAVRRFYAMTDSQVSAIIEDAQARIERDFHAGPLTAALLRLWQRRTLDVMIVSWNNLPQLQEVIRRLYKFTSLPFHLVVCDNGSAPDVGAYLCEAHAEHDNMTVVFNRENAFVGPGTNICMKQGSSDYAVYVCGKEGFVLDYGWEKSLVEYMDANPKVGLAGTLCHSPSYLTGRQYPQGIPLFGQFRNQAYATDNPSRRFGHVQGGFFVIRRAMYEAIGGFCDAVPHSYTDVEYSYYAESCGWQLGTPPRLLALFNKTRPGLFSRVDESVAAMHPPMLEDLPLLDRIARGDAAHCNVCGWDGDAFDLQDGVALCRHCQSRPADRSLYRYLAESMLTYRRLPALGINVGTAMETIWRQQFQGQMHSVSECRRIVAEHGRLDFREGSLKLVYLDEVLESGDADAPLLREVDRLLSRDGILLLRLAGGDRRNLAMVTEACGLHEIQPVRFSSRVLRYDSHPLYIGRRAEVAQCVS